MRIRAGLLLVLGLCGLPSSVLAHPKLRKSVPAAGDTLRVSPAAVTLAFSERVELAMSRIEITDERNVVIALSALSHGSDRSSLVAMPLHALAPGAYRLSWRMVGPDGHPTTGNFPFTVLGPPAAVMPVVSGGELPLGPTLSADTEAGARLSLPSYLISRALSFAALIALIGAIIFRYGVLTRSRVEPAILAALERQTAGIGITAAASLIAVSLFRLYLQHRLMSAGGVMAADDPLRMLSATQWGQAWILQVVAATVAAGGLSYGRGGKPGGWTAALATVPFLAGATGMGGHAGASAQPTVAMTADTLHVIGAGGWIGALLCVLIVAVAPAVRDRDERGWRTVAAVVNAFSPLALFFAAIVALTGLISAWLRMQTLSDLFGTEYGLALVRKLVVVSVLVGTGAYNYLRVRPVLGTAQATARLRRSTIVELVVGFVIVILTAVLVATDPPLK